MSNDTLDDPSDTRLVQQAQRGNQAAFEILCERHRRRIFLHLSYLTRNRDEAEDLTQETFIKAAKGLSKLESSASFGQWLKQIATNTFLDVKRKESKRNKKMPTSTLEGLGDMVPSGISSPEERVLAAERFEQAFRQLPPQHRNCLYQHYFLGYEPHLIAQNLELTEGTVKVYIGVARKMLHTTLYDIPNNAIKKTVGETSQ